MLRLKYATHKIFKKKNCKHRYKVFRLILWLVFNWIALVLSLWSAKYSVRWTGWKVAVNWTELDNILWMFRRQLLYNHLNILELSSSAITFCFQMFNVIYFRYCWIIVPFFVSKFRQNFIYSKKKKKLPTLFLSKNKNLEKKKKRFSFKSVWHECIFDR